MEVAWASESNVKWFPINAGDGVVSDISGRDVPECKWTIDDEVISRHFNAVKVSFLVDHLFSLANAHDATMAALDSKGAANVPAEVIEKTPAGR